MTRIYIKLLMGIMIFTGLAAGFSPLVGRLRPSNPVLDGMYLGCEGQPQPCWYGIQPGQTSLKDALKIVNRTNFVKMDQNDYVVTIVYQNATMRCGVELRTEDNIVDTVTIINCLDKQMGDVVKSLRNVNHKLPFTMGMLDATLSDESSDHVGHYIPCLDYTPYGQIIGMPMGAATEKATATTAGWHDILPYGWYVHTGGSLTCDVVEGVTKFS